MTDVTPWRTRVIWALVGAGAAVAITSLSRTSESSREHVAPAVEAASAPVDATPVVAPPAAVPHTEPSPVPESPPPAPAASPPAAPFEIPLPMMPGARVMKRGQRPDEELGGTIFTLSLSVPAPGMQVESFYRSALADAKLVVTGGSREPTTMGSGHRSSLRGRGREANVHVNLQQRAGTLRTIVRIIWRTPP